MKERPILFSAPMVRAILDGSKTQTRRIVKPQPEAGQFPEETGGLYCPYGQPGDRLWVKETWRAAQPFDHLKPTDLSELVNIQYEADKATNGSQLDSPGKTRVSLFMRQWMSRITLEITDVRVQRLQEITEEDAKAEGVEWTPFFNEPAEAYASLWDKINGPGAWDANPFVWAATFNRIAARLNEQERATIAKATGKDVTP